MNCLAGSHWSRTLPRLALDTFANFTVKNGKNLWVAVTIDLKSFTRGEFLSPRNFTPCCFFHRLPLFSPPSLCSISLSFDSLPHPPQHAVNGRLDESYAPFIRKPRSSSSSASGWSSGTSASSAAGITTTSVRQRWNWIPTQRGGGVDKEVRSLD